MNFLHIAGNLGADPEVRFTSGGQKLTVLRVAAKLKRRGDKDETAWWRVTIWGEQFDKMIAYLKKGSSVIVMGEMDKPTMYNDKDGQAQISLSMTASHVMFSPFGKTGDGKSAGVPGMTASSPSGRPANSNSPTSLENAFDQAYGSGFSQAQGSSRDEKLDGLDHIFPADEEIPF